METPKSLMKTLEDGKISHTQGYPHGKKWNQEKIGGNEDYKYRKVLLELT